MSGLWSRRPLPEGPVDPADAPYLEAGGVHADHAPSVFPSGASRGSPGAVRPARDGTSRRTGGRTRSDARAGFGGSIPPASTAASSSGRSRGPTAASPRTRSSPASILDTSVGGIPSRAAPVSSRGIASAPRGDDRPRATASSPGGSPVGPTR